MLAETSGKTRVERDVPLAPFTTLGVGGNARYYVRAGSETGIARAIEFADANSLDIFVLGGGSNIVVSDDGFDGLVVHIVPKGVTFDDDGVVRVAAGEEWDGFVAECVERDLAGIECLSGIPGFVGGTPVQNVGAYGQEVAETIRSVRCFDRESHEFVELLNAECGFEYRKSIFNTSIRDRYIVVSVLFQLKKGGSPKLSYKDLVEYFDGREASLAEVRQAVLDVRQSKSMVVDQTDPNSRSVGSFFKNPIVPLSVAGAIAEMLGIEKPPQFPVDKDNIKIPAAWLIEQAGFLRGFVLGNTGISERHSLAIINRGGATAAEIIALKDLIQKKVSKKFGIELQPEPIFVGFSRNS